MIDRKDVTAVVLCGGKGARLHGQDKPLILVESRRIIDHILEQLEQQVANILLSCSRNVALYEALGYQVVVDSEPARGPLAGIVESVQFVYTEWMLTVPGDVPFLPKTLISRLSESAQNSGIAVPLVAEQRENLFLLMNRHQRQDLQNFYSNGGTAVKYWLDKISAQPTDLSDLDNCFLNINTYADLDVMKRQIDSGA